MRSIWQGSISFGLINIPVKLYSAVRERSLAFHYLRKTDLCPVKYQRVCKGSREEIPFRDIVHGFEYEKGEFVILDKKDFENANLRKTHSIDVFQFADAKEIEISLFEKPYYLEPVKEARKAYALLLAALKKTGKVGIAKFVLRTREKLAAVRPQGNFLVLDQIRFADEIVSPKELDLPQSLKADERELAIAVKLVQQLTDKFDLEKYHDTYTQELRKMIAQKAKGQRPKAKGEIPVNTEMEDIMAKLKASLAEAKKEKVRVR